jgi:hypothetical protein
MVTVMLQVSKFLGHTILQQYEERLALMERKVSEMATMAEQVASVARILGIHIQLLREDIDVRVEKESKMPDMQQDSRG